MASDNPFHEGELAVQTRAGEGQNARMTGGAINARISGRAMQFIERQPMVIVGTLDSEGRVWASVLFGEPGFLRAANDRTLALNRAESHTVDGDPVWGNLEEDARVGLLLIELESRRRFRINGRVHGALDGRLIVDVEQAYGNCPKYIQRRRWRLPGTKPSGRIRPSRHGAQLSIAQQACITGADTFFVASAHPQQGVDVSHRGGRPGFVEVLNPHRLRVPDYTGNSMFNTLGNFTSYPHAGLLFIDFTRHRILQLTGRPELVWDAPDERGETGGTNRYWEFEIEAWREAESGYHLEWELIDYSPFIPRVRELRNSTGVQALPLKVERIWLETDRVKGFQLTAPDGRDLPMFEPSAHLPIMVRDTSGNWVERHYSLLSDPTDRSCYRIGVLAELQGRGGSLYLHESVQAGGQMGVILPLHTTRSR